MEETKFEQWALLELMGRQRIAGKCSEQVIAGTGFLRVDVPETATNPPFTRFISPNSIYAINPITEDVARVYAGNINAKPIDSWDIHEFVKKAEQRQLELSSKEENEEEEYE